MESLEQSSDTDVVSAVLAGDQDAFADVIRRHHGVVRAVVSRMLAGRNETDELVQDVFVAAFRDLAAFDVQRSLAGWLAGIARHQVLMRLRQQKRRHRLLEDYRQDVVRDLEAATPATDDDGGLRLALQDCQGALAALAAQAVELRYHCGLDLADVAQRLGRSVVATRQLLYRIRGQLRDCLEKHGVRPS